MTIRAILFDAAGTLIYLPRGVGWHYREVFARHGLQADENRLTAAFAEAFKAGGSRAAAAAPPGTANFHIGTPPHAARPISRPDDDKQWWRTLVRRVITACDLHPPEPAFDTLFEDLYAHFAQPGVWALYPDALPVLEALHGKYKLAILSNFDRRLYPVLEHLGIRHFFDAILISSEIGIDKPDPRAFAIALHRLAVPPAETIHAGDDPTHDWQAAQNAGLHLYKVHRPQTTLENLPTFARSLSSPT